MRSKSAPKRPLHASTDSQSSTAKIEAFELSVKKAEHYTPVSTTRILSKFIRDSPPEIHPEALSKRLSEAREHSKTVDELRRWARYRETSTIWKPFLRFVFGGWGSEAGPSEEKLYRCIDHFFPARSELLVNVCDFGPGQAQRREVRLGDIEAEFQSKPEWATVRWIHAPLGVSLLHSSVEALFFHTGSKEMGRPFIKGGRAGWPYLEIETLELRKASSIQDARDVLRILKPEQEINDTLDRGVWVGDNNENLKKDVTWRAQYVGKAINFLELAEADLPWQLSEGSSFNMTGQANGVRTTKLEKSAQSLARHTFFEDAYLARNPFRTFHRNDGFLLTMSPGTGVDYLNTNLPHYLEKSQEALAEDNFASAIAQIYMEFSETGTDTWHRANVEWFLVYLITEIGTTPHNIRQGYSVPSLMDAYDSIVHELKERRYDHWQRNATIKLVRAYLVCIDELAVLEAIFSKKLDFFQRLRHDMEKFEEQDDEDSEQSKNRDGETAIDRISFAEHVMKESAAQCKRLNAELRESMNSLFQLRSIEQNELAIIADTQNKALFVFTTVTIIFLPLSFFTSYFGMNLQGIINTDRTEVYFWKVCGPVAILIVIMAAMYAYRYGARHTYGSNSAV